MAKAHQRRVDKWSWSITAILVVLVVLPGYALMFTEFERFGARSGDVFNSGAATVRSCSHRVLGAPYRCDVSVSWRQPGESPVSVSVRSLRPLAGTAEVVHRECGRPSTPGMRCPVYTADYPDPPGLLYLVLALLVFGLFFVVMYAANRLAHRIVGPLKPAVTS
ncbi:hypothetical protein ADL15_46315 [Actinoplanes awajinensis subsp. mycoplanecinus]|uniref:Uncharacterized protein n=1 Tax=Actinoplanes awajinensis subsp. mycoplanecinus TaxID=135947 RepID=A0A101JB86_9ACTN|nr:hypothetical protein ADL15_46315 [Actinoplanes awajinensis subsp. mycoplanecinus]